MVGKESERETEYAALKNKCLEADYINNETILHYSHLDFPFL